MASWAQAAVGGVLQYLCLLVIRLNHVHKSLASAKAIWSQLLSRNHKLQQELLQAKTGKEVQRRLVQSQKKSREQQLFVKEMQKEKEELQTVMGKQREPVCFQKRCPCLLLKSI